jgi:hypothetical protein
VGNFPEIRTKEYSSMSMTLGCVVSVSEECGPSVLIFKELRPLKRDSWKIWLKNAL